MEPQRIQISQSNSEGDGERNTTILNGKHTVKTIEKKAQI